MAILVNGIEVAGLGKGVPQGGTANQYLIKKSEVDYDTMWKELQNSNIENGEGELSIQMVNSNNHANGDNSTAFGLSTTAAGKASHAEGGYELYPKEFIDDVNEVTVTVYGSYASGNFSHAEGQQTYAGGWASHSEGIQTGACGVSSHAEGRATKASGEHSHAEGDGAMSSGYASHAEGENTIASGVDSHAEGYETIANQAYQHVQGTYNIMDTENEYAHIVGNGGSNTRRSNAHTLDWDGNAWFAGDVYVGSASGTNKDDDSVKLATTTDLANYLPIDGNASSASKLGSTTIGSTTTPIYLNAGTPTACNFKIMVADDLPDESPDYNGTICIVY